MPEQIEQYMRTLKLGGMAREWRNEEFQSTEQYVRELLELRERESTESTAFGDNRLTQSMNRQRSGIQ